MEQGLFGRQTIGIDGTKMKAWNSRERKYNKKVLEKRIRDAEDKVDRYLKELDMNDEMEKDEQEIKKMKEKIEAPKKRAEEMKSIGKRMEDEGVKEISLTDPDAKLMKTSHGMEVCYNAQVFLDEKSHLIAEYDLTNDQNDKGSLIPISRNTRNFLGSSGMEVVADKGYFSFDNIRDL